MNGWTIAWLAWLGAFVAMEGPALVNKKSGDTLSEHVWKWFATARVNGTPTAWIRVRRVILVSFLVWLLVHFTTGGRFV